MPIEVVKRNLDAMAAVKLNIFHRTEMGIFDPTLDSNREETFKFLEAFLAEMTQLFPDTYFHFGGDEVHAKQWNESASVQAFARKRGLKDAHAIQAYFNQRIQKILQKHGKIMIGWDEVLHLDLPRATSCWWSSIPYRRISRR